MSSSSGRSCHFPWARRESTAQWEPCHERVGQAALPALPAVVPFPLGRADALRFRARTETRHSHSRLAPHQCRSATSALRIVLMFGGGDRLAHGEAYGCIVIRPSGPSPDQARGVCGTRWVKRGAAQRRMQGREQSHPKYGIAGSTSPTQAHRASSIEARVFRCGPGNGSWSGSAGVNCPSLRCGEQSLTRRKRPPRPSQRLFRAGSLVHWLE